MVVMYDYDPLIIPRDTLEEVYKYLYEFHQKDIWSVNENRSLVYYTNDTHDCLIGTLGLFSGYIEELIYGQVDMNRLGRISKNKEFIKTRSEVISYEHFKLLLEYLRNLVGEYADRLFSIKKHPDGHIIEWRRES